MTGDLLSLAYISVGCNKSAQVMDWGENNLICFGACNAVALYDPEIGKIRTTLCGHKGDVNCVKWIKGLQNSIVSGSSDTTAIVWSIEIGKHIFTKSITFLNGHKGTILAVEGRYISDYSATLVATSASDNTVRIWQRNIESSEFLCKKEICIGSSFALCLNMLPISDSKAILLSFGTDSAEIMLYSMVNHEDDVTYLGKAVGHEDWIRCVDMTVSNGGEILIATSSQDMMIRIYKLSSKNTDALDGAFALKKTELHVDGSIYYLSLETVLYGHEGWVYSVNWSPSKEDSPHLLSASFDRTLIIWKPCPDSGVWLEESRMGELGGDSSLGYYGAKFNLDGTCVLAHSYQGSFHLWRKADCKWVTDYAAGGHFESVTDISWEHNGRYLISVSSDKTTRLHAPCVQGLNIKSKPWCELSRPQIHGHGLHSVSCLANLGFASCSEEKVVRAFLPSVSVLKLLNYFCESVFENELRNKPSLPSSASITALGLSNVGNFDDNGVMQSTVELNAAEAIPMGISPNEDFLAQHTLWPEVMKLYGHGNDVFAVSASHDGKTLATASKATTPEQAKIILWDTQSWNILSKLDGHQLTVTQMAFSPDDSYLLSVSRDRKWCLFEKGEEGLYKFKATSQKGKVMHSRIIWTCAWTHDSLYFATGSRDSKIIVWDIENPVSSMISDHGPVTALDFGPVLVNANRYILAVGHESGLIQIYSWCSDWTLLHNVPAELSHHLSVQRLQFRPVLGITGNSADVHQNLLQLGSCSDDHSVRVFNINLDYLVT